MNRRNFVKRTGIAAAAFSILPVSELFAQKQKVKIGIIGVASAAKII